MTKLILFLFLLIAPGFLMAEQKQPKGTITVMSYNIHYGIGMDKKLDLARIAKVITDQDPDIVGLQEIGNQKMAEELGKLTGMRFIFGPSLGSETGYGDAILSKFPFKSAGNHSIPSASGSRYQAMAVDVDLSSVYGNGKTVRFINTHFDWLRTIGSEEARLSAVRVIERAFYKESVPPSILAGDLNATPQSDPLKRLIANGWHHETLAKSHFTIPSKNPVRQIDYLLLRPKTSWKVVRSFIVQEPVASDHLPVVKTLRLIQ